MCFISLYKSKIDVFILFFQYYDGFSVTKSLGFQEFPLLPEITLHDQEERITEVVMKLMKIFAHMIHPYSSTDEKVEFL